jgi:hypothetical protein
LNGGPVVGTISSNDCQYGSTILISNLKICRNQDQCLKSLQFIAEEYIRLFENDDPELLEMEHNTFEPNVDTIYINISGEQEKYTIIGPLSEDEIKEIVTIQRTYDTDSCLRFMQRKYGTHFVINIACNIDCVRDAPVISPSIKDLSIISDLGVPLSINIYVNNSIDRETATDSYDNRVINLINKMLKILHTISLFSINADYLSFRLGYFNTFQNELLKNKDLFSITLSGIQVPCMPFVFFLQKIPLLTELSLDNCTLDVSDTEFDEDEFSDEYTKALKNITTYSVSRQTFINDNPQLKYMWRPLQQATNLQSLSLKWNNFHGPRGISGLHHLTHLTFLDVSFNDFLSSEDDHDTIDMFCSNISKMINLESLILRVTNIDKESMVVILDTLIHLPRLTYLDVSSNDLDGEDFIQIEETLPNLETLVTNRRNIAGP